MRTLVQVKHEMEVQHKHLVAELQVMSRYRHPNLCVLLGFASTDTTPPRRCLVYEMCPQGCLRSRLSHQESSDQQLTLSALEQQQFAALPPLTPAQRLTISVGIGITCLTTMKAQFQLQFHLTYLCILAQGLEYLHRQVPPVIHRDVKSAVSTANIAILPRIYNTLVCGVILSLLFALP